METSRIHNWELCLEDAAAVDCLNYVRVTDICEVEMDSIGLEFVVVIVSHSMIPSTADGIGVRWGFTLLVYMMLKDEEQVQGDMRVWWLDALCSRQ
ncbi:hypothetical protein C5167_001199 [Papaver somniferum]|uniref:Uncharacterized protein n=1 Tax=Papaver somniferum TaxID=3469 RepID=A0A4Y7KXX0_PAPSO|nr:hypothetical protein C5167_001199 [Papaver somniferum]